jgi:glyoxylase-like metal-dependent hydrolase (beta-lactamase superfamily II)
LLESGGDRLLIWGDVFHAPEIQSRRPEIAVTFDSDPAMAIASRRHALEMAATERLLVAGMHMNFPRFAHIARDGDGFMVQPIVWSPVV